MTPPSARALVCNCRYHGGHAQQANHPRGPLPTSLSDLLIPHCSWPPTQYDGSWGLVCPGAYIQEHSAGGGRGLELCGVRSTADAREWGAWGAAQAAVSLRRVSLFEYLYTNHLFTIPTNSKTPQPTSIHQATEMHWWPPITPTPTNASRPTLFAPNYQPNLFLLYDLRLKTHGVIHQKFANDCSLIIRHSTKTNTRNTVGIQNNTSCTFRSCTGMLQNHPQHTKKRLQ